jgi:acetyltransferase-like isoleucine patch superfamily enzyme
MPPKIHPLSDVSGRVGEGTRIWQFVVVLAGARIGARCNINAQVFVENDVCIGDNVTIKCGVQLWDGIVLEDDVFVGPNVTFTNDRYPRSKHFSSPRPDRTRVMRGASIGANSTIRGGVTIGRWAMIGAASLVTCDVPDGELWYGSPATSHGPAPRQPRPDRTANHRPAAAG